MNSYYLIGEFYEEFSWTEVWSNKHKVQLRTRLKPTLKNETVSSDRESMKVAFIIPCLNEETTIERVVRDCLAAVPGCHVYVIDNGSEDKTAECALKSGAHVIHSPLRGKGNAIRHAFRVLDYDYLVMIDGDGTYPIQETRRLLNLAREFNYEMVMGSRLQLGKAEAFRPMHYFGNRLFTGLVRAAFGQPVQDLLTGFRVFSRRFTQEMNLLSQGFEIETEMTIRAMCQRLPFCEVAIHYGERPEGSKSKLRTFRDGWIILGTIFRYLKDFRPLLFFSLLAGVCVALQFVLPPDFQITAGVAGALFLVLGFYLDSTLSLQNMRLNREQPADQEPGKRFRAS